MQKTLTAIGVVLVLAIIVFAKESTPVSGDVHSEKYWQERVNTLGADKAYTELKQLVKDREPGDAHSTAHAFGGGLYLAKGAAGLSTCDSEIFYGCFHQFIGEMISDEGVSVLKKLNDACGENIECFHGIGHGILGYEGYTENNLKQAIVLCKQLVDQNLFGCYGGAFMEYNLRSMLSVTKQDLRPIPENLFSPCELFEGTQAFACYFLQPQLWGVHWENDNATSTARRMGEACETLPLLYQKYCVGGSGQMMIPLSHYSPASAALLCDALSDTLYNQVLCRAYAARTASGTISREAGKGVCVGLPQEIERVCIFYMSEGSPGDFKLTAP